MTLALILEEQPGEQLAAQLVVFTLAVIVIRLCPEGLYARVRGR